VTQAAPIVEARKLGRTYGASGSEVVALADVDVAVAPGEFVAVMGASGSGKSTLLHLLGGLDKPTTGEVWLDGRQLADLSTKELARVRAERVGFVFQLFNLLPSLTTAENVALPAVIARQRPAAYAARVDELLDAVGLGDKHARLPSQLSGGEQQRVAIARALMMNPAVLLADEPTGNLDSRSGEEVMTMLTRFHGEGQTIVLVTHDVKVAGHAQRLLSMEDGHIVDELTLTGSRASTAKLRKLVQLGD
jgi:putative ABC transport system ATP-binding protein